MTLKLEKKKYEGSIFGFNYSIDFDTDEEFVEWIAMRLKTHSPLLGKILSKLLLESEEYTNLKSEVSVLKTSS